MYKNNEAAYLADFSPWDFRDVFGTDYNRDFKSNKKTNKNIDSHKLSPTRHIKAGTNSRNNKNSHTNKVKTYDALSVNGTDAMKEYKKMRDLFINAEGRTGTSNLDLNATMENFVKKFGIANIRGYNSTTVNNSVQTKALYGTLSGRNLNLTENKPKALDNRTENSSRSESPRPDQLNFANPDLTTTPPVPQLGSPNTRPVPPGYSNAPKAPSPFIPHPNSYYPYGVPIVPDLPLPPGHPDGPRGEPNPPVANQTATDPNYEIGSLLHREYCLF